METGTNSSLQFYGHLHSTFYSAQFGLRTLFYCVFPSESYFEKPSDVPEYNEHVNKIISCICYSQYRNLK